jgi:uncharacterized protein (DUF2141 family)
VKFVIVAAVAAALFGAASAADLATLTVQVDGVSNKGGNLRVGLFDQASFPVRGSKPINGRVVPATVGTMIVTIEGIVPGEYGVKVLDDENANGVMDFKMGFLPSEPYGFSNDAKPNMGPPAWNDVKITIKPGANRITIHLL